jgi:hypothetical protein
LKLCIFDNPMKLMATDPREQWKLARARVNILTGVPKSEVEKCLDLLLNAVVKEAKMFPDANLSRVPSTLKKS